MPTVPENTPSSTTTTNGVHCEPDDDWKENLRKRIEEGLQSMVADAKENHATELSKAPDTTEARIRLEADYKDAMQTIKSLASEQYKIELERERNQRRWTAGVPMTPGWSQYFHQEQQNIMNSIKQSNQTDNSVRTASESPTEERRSAIPKPSNEPPAALAPTTPVLLPVYPSPPVRSAGERQSVRRGSDVRTSLSGDRDDPGSFRRNHHASVHVRPSLPDNWVATEIVDEPEELLRSPPPRTRVPSIDRPIDRPSQPSPASPDIRWDSSLGRSSGSIHSAEPRSPPRAPPPEVWKPAISSVEDALPPPAAKPYNLGRRGSTTSMRSTGSGASIRPSIRETIPERAYDDGPDESDIEENDYGRFHETVEQVRPWISTTTTTDRSRAPPPEVRKPAISPAEDALPRPPAAKPYNLGRRGSATSMRSTGSGASIRPSITETIPERADDDGSDESDIEENDYGRVHETVEQVRPRISTTTTDKSRNKVKRPHLRKNSRQSSVDADLGSSSLRSDDRHRPIDGHGKPPPYYDYRDQSPLRDSYAPHRDHQPPPQDPRPISTTTRSSYGGDDRDNGAQYSTTPHRPHGPRPPPYFPQRESRPISRQVSFTRQLHLDLDDDNDERDIIDRGGVGRDRDRERYWDRDYDGDRDRDREAERLRDLEARKHILEENRREADDQLRRMELEIQQLAGERKEEEERREDMRRKEEDAKRREEEARKKEAEIWKMEEEVKRKKEDAARKAKELKRMEEVAKKKEADAKKKEKDARLKEQDAKRKEEAAKRKVEEARRKAEELNKKEEEAKQREAQLEQDAEKTKQMQLEAQKIAEDLKKKEEEAHRKDLEMKEREDILRRREEELIRREADNFRREQEAREKEKEEARKKEELKEKIRKDEEVKQEAMRRKEEMRKERARQEEVEREDLRKIEEARRVKARQEEEEVRREETRKREEAFMETEREETRRRAAEAKRAEENMKRKLEEEEAKRKAEEGARQREEDSRRQEEARLERFRREQEEKRLQNESQHLDDMFFDLDPSLVDSKLMDEQLKVLQQAEFRKRVDDIRRTREERKRNDSVGNDSAWSNPSYPSNSPGTSPSMSRSPHYNGPPIPSPERNAGSSTSSWGAGAAPAWGPSIKPTVTASSPNASRSSTNTSTGKPRTGSVSSGTYPTSSSPHTASSSEAERTRKQQEFSESQQEQFRRAQEKLEADRQLKSAGRPLSREELQRVFEHHERLWTRLNTLNELSWNDFPWPMAKQPSNPDDMSLPQISAYIQSPLYPDKDKSRTPKDRIKEHIKRWHPDRFETKLLPKVVEDEREKVKHGAGNVARYLSDLLRKENENNRDIFGD